MLSARPSEYKPSLSDARSGRTRAITRQDCDSFVGHGDVNAAKSL
jgi:hypothetical protein